MKTKIFILSLVPTGIFILDQWTKKLVMKSIPLGGSRPIIPGIFDIIHTHNKGAAFGFMSEMSESVRLPFFYLMSTVALVAVLLYFFRLKDSRKGVFCALALILGGAAGNIFDRIQMGEVVDFLSFHWYDTSMNGSLLGYKLHLRLEWPAFNIADASISVAVILLMFFMLTENKISRGPAS